MKLIRRFRINFINYIKGSIKKRWLLSCVSLTIIPVIIGVFIYRINIENYKKQTIQNNEVLLLQIKNLMDQGFYDVKSIVQKLALEPSLNAFPIHTDNSDNILLKRQLKEKLSQYQQYSSYIRDIYVYFRDTDEVISDKTTAPSSITYYTFHKDTNLSYDQWLSIMKRTHINETVVFPIAKTDSSLAYINDLSNFVSTSLNATIVVLIDNNNIISMVKSVVQKNSCDLNILLNDNSPVLPLSSLFSPVANNFNDINKSNSSIQRIHTAKGAVLSFLTSGSLDITYILGTPQHIYIEELKDVNRLFNIGLFIVILGSIFFTVRFIYGNYAPIKEILNMVHTQETSDVPGNSADEYAVIKNAIVLSRNASNEMQNKLYRQNKKFFSTILSLMMYNSLFTAEIVEKEDLEDLRLNFAHDYFFVVLLSLDTWKTSDTLKASDALIPFSEEEALHLNSIIRDSKILSENKFSYWVIEMSDRFILLFNIDELSKEKCTDYVQNIGTELRACWHKACKNNLLIIPSKCFKGLESISDAYQEAEYSMKYHLIFGTSYQPVNEEDSTRELSGSYFYPPEEESKLFNVIVNGDAVKAKETFNHIWKVNMNKNQFTVNFLYCLLFDIMGTVIRACNLITPVSSIITNPAGIVEKIIKEKSLDEGRKYILKFIDEICYVYSKEHSKSTDKLKNEILKYIDTHYYDQNLSVEYIGDVFSKSRAYLFSLFKEDTGFSLLYHISKVRIERAKELLQGSQQYSIQDVANLVGFNSAISFTRTFKKFENITPSRYQELNSSQMKRP